MARRSGYYDDGKSARLNPPKTHPHACAPPRAISGSCARPTPPATPCLKAAAAACPATCRGRWPRRASSSSRHRSCKTSPPWSARRSSRASASLEAPTRCWSTAPAASPRRCGWPRTWAQGPLWSSRCAARSLSGLLPLWSGSSECRNASTPPAPSAAGSGRGAARRPGQQRAGAAAAAARCASRKWPPAFWCRTHRPAAGRLCPRAALRQALQLPGAGAAGQHACRGARVPGRQEQQGRQAQAGHAHARPQDRDQAAAAGSGPLPQVRAAQQPAALLGTPRSRRAEPEPVPPSLPPCAAATASSTATSSPAT